MPRSRAAAQNRSSSAVGWPRPLGNLSSLTPLRPSRAQCSISVTASSVPLVGMTPMGMMRSRVPAPCIPRPRTRCRPAPARNRGLRSLASSSTKEICENTTSASMPSRSCSCRRCSGGPVPAQVSKVGTCVAMSSLFTRTLRVTPMVLGSPPSTTTASEPLGIFTRLGARSRMDAATRSRQMSGLRSMWPSAEMTLYARPIPGSFQTVFQTVAGRRSTGVWNPRAYGTRLERYPREWNLSIRAGAPHAPGSPMPCCRGCAGLIRSVVDPYQFAGGAT